MKEEEFGTILQDCLARIQQGQETVEQVLADYPDLAGELAPELLAATWIQAQQATFEPRPGFVSASRGRLLAHLEQEKHAGMPEVGGQGFSLGRVFRLHLWAARLAIALVVIACLFMTGNGVAYATRNLIPGDQLYSLKLTVEKAQLALSLSEVARTELRVEIVQRRLAELNALSLEGRYEQVLGSVHGLQASVDLALSDLQATARTQPRSAKLLGEKLDKTLKEQGQMLRMWAKTAPPAARPAYNQLLGITDASTTTLEGIIATATATIPGTLTPTPIYTGLPAVPVASPTASHTVASKTPVPPSATQAQATRQPTQGTAAPAQGTQAPGGTTPTPEPSKTHVKPTSRPTNTHRPTQKPDSTKAPQPTKEPPATKEPKPTKPPKP